MERISNQAPPLSASARAPFFASHNLQVAARPMPHSSDWLPVVWRVAAAGGGEVGSQSEVG
eukprot:3369907-Rhodomonas_salina.1